MAVVSPFVRLSCDELAPLRLQYIWGVGVRWDEPQRVRGASKDTSSPHHLEVIFSGRYPSGQGDEPHRYQGLKKTLRNLRPALEATPHSNRQAEHICLKAFETTCVGVVALKLTTQKGQNVLLRAQTADKQAMLSKGTHNGTETLADNLLESEAKLPHRGRGHKRRSIRDDCPKKLGEGILWVKGRCMYPAVGWIVLSVNKMRL